MATRRKKACCSACATGRKCSGRRSTPSKTVRSVKARFQEGALLVRSGGFVAPPIASMSDAQLRRFTSRNPRLLRGRAKQQWISAKIRLLRHEEYPPTQAIAIAYHMAGVARPRTKTRRSTPRRRTATRRRR